MRCRVVNEANTPQGAGGLHPRSTRATNYETSSLVGQWRIRLVTIGSLEIVTANNELICPHTQDVVHCDMVFKVTNKNTTCLSFNFYHPLSFPVVVVIALSTFSGEDTRLLIAARTKLVYALLSALLLMISTRLLARPQTAAHHRLNCLTLPYLLWLAFPRSSAIAKQMNEFCCCESPSVHAN